MSDTPCAGMNCGTITSEHSPECIAEHAAAAAGGQFVKSAAPARTTEIERKVYRGTPEHAAYLNARFHGSAVRGLSFEWDGHRWAYRHSSFDDGGDYDVIWRPAPTEQTNG